MESLLTLSLGDYSAVELTLRLTVVLIAMTALLLLLATLCVTRSFRLPMIITAVALGGAAWFESGTWIAWKEAFELAGTSYCVTGHLLAGENRIIAWSLAIPAILFSFGLILIPSGKTGETRLLWLAVAMLALALAAPLSLFLALLISLFAIKWILYKEISLHHFFSKNGFSQLKAKSPLFGKFALGLAFIFLGMVANFLGSHHLFFFGNGVNAELVRGEIIRSLIDVFSLILPSIILLIGVLKTSNDQLKNDRYSAS